MTKDVKIKIIVITDHNVIRGAPEYLAAVHIFEKEATGQEVASSEEFSG